VSAFSCSFCREKVKEEKKFTKWASSTLGHHQIIDLKNCFWANFGIVLTIFKKKNREFKKKNLWKK
jgi:hypothetical protein